MTARPKQPPPLTSAALEQALGARAPAALTREGRVRLLGEAFAALLEGKPPSREAALFLGGAGKAWLEQGGSLERDFLRVTKPQSHNTPSRIWAQVHHDEGEEQQGDE